MRSFTLALSVSVVVGVGAVRHHLSSQVVVEQQVVSPTYVAASLVQKEVIITALAPSYAGVAGHWDHTPDNGIWNLSQVAPTTFRQRLPGSRQWSNGIGGTWQWNPARGAVS